MNATRKAPKESEPIPGEGAEKAPPPAAASHKHGPLPPPRAQPAPPPPPPVSTAGRKADPAAAAQAHPVELSPVEETHDAVASAEGRELNLQMILDLPVDLHVELGQARVPIQNILSFGVGSIIELDRLAGEPVDILVNGKLIGQGEVMVVNESFGIRVTRLVEPEKRIKSL